MMAESGTDQWKSENWYAADVATFGDRLAGAREAAGLSQESLAQRLGVRLSTVQAWEEDLAEPRGNRLQMLAGMLNVSLTWLLTAEGDGLASPETTPKTHFADVDAALADLQRLRLRAIGLADEIASVENRLRKAMRVAA